MAKNKQAVKKGEPTRGRGRPPTGHQTLRFRLPPELLAALERRLIILEKKSLPVSLSFYLRESLREKLGKDLRSDRRDRSKTPRST